MFVDERLKSAFHVVLHLVHGLLLAHVRVDFLNAQRQVSHVGRDVAEDGVNFVILVLVATGTKIRPRRVLTGAKRRKRRNGANDDADAARQRRAG